MTLVLTCVSFLNFLPSKGLNELYINAILSVLCHILMQFDISAQRLLFGYYNEWIQFTSIWFKVHITQGCESCFKIIWLAFPTENNVLNKCYSVSSRGLLCCDRIPAFRRSMPPPSSEWRWYPSTAIPRRPRVETSPPWKSQNSQTLHGSMKNLLFLSYIFINVTEFEKISNINNTYEVCAIESVV
jgi:hypothetical protein